MEYMEWNTWKFMNLRPYMVLMRICGAFEAISLQSYVSFCNNNFTPKKGISFAEIIVIIALKNIYTYHKYILLIPEIIRYASISVYNL